MRAIQTGKQGCWRKASAISGSLNGARGIGYKIWRMKMSHFYCTETNNLHTKVLNAAATKREGKDVYRDANLKDARKNGWLPGWTAIGGMLDKPALNKWKKAEFKRVMEEEPRCGDGETWAEYWRRIESRTRKEIEQYAEIGSGTHARIEYELTHEMNETNAYYRDEDKKREAIVNSCVKSFWKWYYGAVDYDNHARDNITEQTFAAPEWGFGGTIDLQYTDSQNRYAIVDFKTKRTKPDEKIVQYNENKRQLVAYALGVGKINVYTRFGEFEPDTNPFNYPILGNLYLSTTEPGRWEYIQIPPEEIPNLILDVRDLTRLWQREHKFSMEKQDA